MQVLLSLNVNFFVNQRDLKAFPPLDAVSCMMQLSRAGLSWVRLVQRWSSPECCSLRFALSLCPRRPRVLKVHFPYWTLFNSKVKRLRMHSVKFDLKVIWQWFSTLVTLQNQLGSLWEQRLGSSPRDFDLSGWVLGTRLFSRPLVDSDVQSGLKIPHVWGN